MCISVNYWNTGKRNSAISRLFLDVTSSLEEDLLHLNTNSFLGFAVLWERMKVNIVGMAYQVVYGSPSLISFADSSDTSFYPAVELRITTLESSPVPEPSSLMLTGIGLLTAAFFGRRTRR